MESAVEVFNPARSVRRAGLVRARSGPASLDVPANRADTVTMHHSRNADPVIREHGMFLPTSGRSRISSQSQ
jgi:hypothetical protein